MEPHVLAERMSDPVVKVDVDRLGRQAKQDTVLRGGNAAGSADDALEQQADARILLNDVDVVYYHCSDNI